MNVLSLFDGMSCGQIALERAGIKVNNYYASEIDKYAIKVTRANYPNTIQLGDIKELNAKDLPKIDLMIGGSPCTNFSFAGKQNGMSTKSNIEITNLDHYLELKKDGFEFEGQSYLFWEYVRLLKEVKPKYFLLENVKMSKKWEKVLSEAIGVEPILINSALVSAQNRQRLYWTNIPNVKQPEDKGILLKDVLESTVISKFYLSEKAIEYMNRLRNGRKRWYYHSNNLNEKSSCLTANMWKGVPYGVVKEKNRRLTPIECERLQTVPDNYTKHVSDTQRFKAIGNGWTVDVIAHIFKELKQTEKI